MLSLVCAYELFSRSSWLLSVERAAPFYRQYWASVSQDLQIFFTNWQTQVARALLRYSTNRELIEQTRLFVKQMQDRIIESDFFAHLIGRRAVLYHTVEVACALEGMADALGIVCDEIREKGHAIPLEQHKDRYRSAINASCSFLLAVQEKQRNHEVAYGGFGHGLDNPVQRLDVTGHVTSAFMKILPLLDDPLVAGGFRLQEPHTEA